MRHQTSIALLLFLLLFPLARGDAAENDLWSEYNKAGLAALHKGDYKQAEQLLTAAVREAENGTKSESNLCASLNSLAVVLVEEGKLQSAESLLQRVLRIEEGKLGPEDEAVATVLNNLAQIYRQQGRLSEAEPLSRRVLAIAEKQSGKEDQAGHLAVALNNLASVLQDECHYEESESLLRRSLSIRQKVLGPENEAVASVLNNLAQSSYRQGKYADAESLFRRALAIWQKALGPEHPDCALCMSNLAAVLNDQGRQTEAEAFYREALAIRERSLGSDNPQVAVSCNDLAFSLDRQSRYAEAEPLYRRAIAIQEKTLGAEHPDLALILHNLADLYREQGKFAQAEVVCRQSLRISEKAFGPTDPRVAAELRALSHLAAMQGHSTEKQESEQRAESISRSLPGGEHPMILESTANAGTAPALNPNRPIKDKWALVIGISSFKDPTMNLKYAAKDAIDFRNYLISDGHFQPDHVRLLTDKLATRENIVNSLGERWLTRLANRDDLVIVYVSSHGSSAKHDIAGVNMLVAYDTNRDNQLATGIPMEWLTQIIKDQVHCDRVVLILDVCHSGAAQTAGKGLKREFAFDLNGVAVGDGQIVLCSSQSDQVSWESANYPNGVFTRRLIEGLRHNGAKTKLSDAFDSMREKVEEEVLRDRAVVQTPVLRKMWQGEDLILAASAVSPRPGLSEPSTHEKQPAVSPHPQAGNKHKQKSASRSLIKAP